MKKIIIFFFLVPLHARLQNYVGISFEQMSGWSEIKAKAKMQNKYIFVDCFATWCGPCKKMDRDIYSNDTVGEYMNKCFISVKIQMDSTLNDNELVQKNYNDAFSLRKEYNVRAYPTFLFISPEGEIMHKDVGFKNIEDFIRMAKDAQDEERQNVRLLHRYQRGEVEYSKMPYLARALRRISDYKQADQVAFDYIHGYLDKLTDEQFCTVNNIAFINEFFWIIGSGDRMFKLCYSKPDMVDVTMRSGYAQSRVDYIIAKEEVSPLVVLAKKTGIEPDWKSMEREIARKYNGDYAERVVLNAKPDFYKFRKDWGNYTDAIVQQVDKRGLDNVSKNYSGATYLNDMAWPVFLYSNNKAELQKALVWSRLSIKYDSTSINAPNNMDTNANLLYKLGKKKEAIALEEKAALRAPRDSAIQQNLTKMRNNQATW